MFLKPPVDLADLRRRIEAVDEWITSNNRRSGRVRLTELAKQWLPDGIDAAWCPLFIKKTNKGTLNAWRDELIKNAVTLQKKGTGLSPVPPPTASAEADLLTLAQWCNTAQTERVSGNANAATWDRLTDESLRVLGERAPLPEATETTKDETVADDWWPMSRFPKKMASKLRMAASPNRKTKPVRSKKFKGVKLYYMPDARRWWSADFEK